MQNITEKIEKTFFVFVNLFVGLYSCVIFWVFALAKLISVSVFNADPVYENDGTFIFLGLMFFILYLYLKFALFPLLYLIPGKFPFVRAFFDRFIDERKFTAKVFISVVIIDLIQFFTVSAFFIKGGNWFYDGVVLNSMVYMCCGFGLIGTYAGMWIFLAIYKYFTKKVNSKGHDE